MMRMMLAMSCFVDGSSYVRSVHALRLWRVLLLVVGRVIFLGVVVAVNPLATKVRTTNGCC
jgi:hypothetical protein